MELLSSKFCKICKRIYKSQVVLSEHIKKHHGGDESVRINSLNNDKFIEQFGHLVGVHKYLCPVCFETFVSGYNCKRHLRRVHSSIGKSDEKLCKDDSRKVDGEIGSKKGERSEGAAEEQTVNCERCSTSGRGLPGSDGQKITIWTYTIIE